MRYSCMSHKFMIEGKFFHENGQIHYGRVLVAVLYGKNAIFIIDGQWMIDLSVYIH